MLHDNISNKFVRFETMAPERITKFTKMRNAIKAELDKLKDSNGIYKRRYDYNKIAQACGYSPSEVALRMQFDPELSQIKEKILRHIRGEFTTEEKEIFKKRMLSIIESSKNTDYYKITEEIKEKTGLEYFNIFYMTKYDYTLSRAMAKKCNSRLKNNIH